MNDSPPLYYERLVAPILGLPRDDLRYLRQEALKKGTGWMQLGREIVITRMGLDLILERLAASSHEPSAQIDFTPALVLPPEKKTEGVDAPTSEATGSDQDDQAAIAAPPAPQNAGTPPPLPPQSTPLVELTVKSCYPNPRILRAFTAEKAIVEVRVRTNKNFVPGMKLKARLGAGGRYDMEGRCPRTRGRY